MAKVEICVKNDLDESGKRVFVVNDREILIVRERDTFHAVSNICPHRGGKLNEGRVEEGAITCLNHGASFDLSSGILRLDLLEEDLRETIDEDNLPFGPLKVYSLTVEGDKIIVKLS